jgi:hypothetical protein
MIIRQQWMRACSAVLVFNTKWCRQQHTLLMLCRLPRPWLLNYEVPRYVTRITRRNMTSCFLPESRKSVSQSVSQSVSHSAVRGSNAADRNCRRPELPPVPARDRKLRHTQSASCCFLFQFIYPSSCYSASSFSSCFTLFSFHFFSTFLFRNCCTSVRYDVLAAISILPPGAWRRVGRYKINLLHLSSG